MNRNIVIAIIIIILLTISYFIFSSSKKNTNTTPDETSLKQSSKSSSVPEAVNKQASFAIFTNGIFRVFTAAMYHNLSNDVYIEASNPNIIKIKKDGITWNDFFSTLPFKLTHECLTTGTKETFCTNKDMTLKFYLNGEKIAKFLDQVIEDRDKLLVTYGNESDETIKKQIEKIPNVY